jgi:hypothetical protein
LQILGDAERSLEYRHAFLDRRKIENFCAWIIRRGELHHWRRVHHEGDRLIAPNPWRVHMDIGRELHFGRQGDTAARNGGSVGLFDGEVQVRGLDIVRNFVAQCRKKLANDIVPGESFPVLRLEELFPNRALGIDEVIAGSRHTLILSDRLGVQKPVGPNDSGIRVGEQRNVDLAPVSEVLQYFLAVIADGSYFDSLFFKSCLRTLQLDQLPFAVRSPVGRTEKQENRALRSL